MSKENKESNEVPALTIVRARNPPALTITAAESPLGGNVKVRTALRSWPGRGAWSERTVQLQFKADAAGKQTASLQLSAADFEGGRGIRGWRSHALEVITGSTEQKLHSTTLVPFWQRVAAFPFVAIAVFMLAQAWLALHETGFFVAVGQVAGTSAFAWIAAQLFGGKTKIGDWISPAVFQRVRIAGVLTLLVVGGVLLVPRALWAKIDNRTGIALTDGSEAQIAAKSRKVVLQGEWSRIWTAVADKFHSDVERKASVGEGPVPLLSGSVVTCREPRSVPAEWLVDRCDRPAQGRCPIETGTDACQFEWAKSVVLDVEKAVGHPPRPGAAWAHLEMPGSEAVEDTAKALGASRAPQVRVDLWEAHVSPPRGEPPRGLWRAKQKEIALLESPDRQLRVKSLGGGGEAAGTGDLQCAPGNALRIEWLTVARGIARPTAITLKRADGSPWATWHLVNGDGGPTLCTPEDGSIPEATVVGIEPAISNQSRLRIVRRDSVLRLELAPLVQHVCYTDDQGERCKGKPTSGTCQQIFKDLPPECSQLWTGCDCST